VLGLDRSLLCSFVPFPYCLIILDGFIVVSYVAAILSVVFESVCSGWIRLVELDDLQRQRKTRRLG
jgi:hypothetical protein